MLNVSEWWVSSRYRKQEPFYQYYTAFPLRQPALLSSTCVIQRLRELIKLCSKCYKQRDRTCENFVIFSSPNSSVTIDNVLVQEENI